MTSKNSNAADMCLRIRLSLLIVVMLILKFCYSLDAFDTSAGDTPLLLDGFHNSIDIEKEYQSRFLAAGNYTENRSNEPPTEDFNNSKSKAKYDNWTETNNIMTKPIKLKINDSDLNFSKSNSDKSEKQSEVIIKPENKTAPTEIVEVKIPITEVRMVKIPLKKDIVNSSAELPRLPPKQMKLGGHPELAKSKLKTIEQPKVVPTDINIKPVILSVKNNTELDVSATIKPIKIKQVILPPPPPKEPIINPSANTSAPIIESVIITQEKQSSNKTSLNFVESSSVSWTERIMTPEVMNYLYYIGIGIAIITIVLLFLCIIFKCCSFIISKLFLSSDSNKYSEFENEKSEPNPKQFHSASFKNKDDLEIMNFRNRELKGELEPAIFYKNEFSKENTGNHRIFELKLEFDSQSEDKNSSKFGSDNLKNINKLDLDLELSSKYSNENSEKPEIDVSFI